MTAEEAWDKITRITNKNRMTDRDILIVRSLMKFMPEKEQAWIEEGLFLREKPKNAAEPQLANQR